MKRDYFFFVFPALLVILLDQISKLAVAAFINYQDSIPVIDGFFNLVHIRNRGMAFGLMNRPDIGIGYYFLIIATILAIVLITFWFTGLRNGDKKMVFGLSLILGGAIGNLIDRLRLREVIDFLDFFIGTYHWPSFNVADSAVSIGTFWILINILFFGSRDNYEGKEYDNNLKDKET